MKYGSYMSKVNSNVQNKIELKVDFANTPGLTQFFLLFFLQGWNYSMPYMKIIHITDISTSLYNYRTDFRLGKLMLPHYCIAYLENGMSI